MSQQRRERRQALEEPAERDPNFVRKVIIAVVIVAAVGGAYSVYYYHVMHQYDDFARCLSRHDVKMYGAYWCPHCADQKALFKDSFKYVNYIECGLPGTTSQLQQVCTEAGIKHFPTWQFPPMGERVEGEVPLADLGLRSGCSLP